MANRLIYIVVACLQLAACAGADGDGTDAANIAPGSAIGSAYTGEYAFDIEFAQFYCDEGIAWYYLGDLDTASLHQSDGRLQVLFPTPLFSDFPSFTGGINADGTFKLGAVSQDSTTAVFVIDGFATGTALRGTFTLHLYGSDLECNANGTIAFTR